MPIECGSSFRNRYAVESLRDGGILIDLATGTYLRLNATAALICSILGTADEVVIAREEIARALGGNEDEAATAIEDVVAGLQALGPRRDPVGAFRYIPSAEGGYLLVDGGIARIAIGHAGKSLRLAAPGTPISAPRMFEYLKAVAPKLLFLQSKVVIHGAASRTPRGACVISGESGAGKTTTARALAEAGQDLLAEDMLAIASLAPLSVHNRGEKVINDWCYEVAEHLSAHPSEEVNTTVLRRSDLGEPVSVSEIWFIDRARRTALDTISPRRLGETAGALAMMTSIFLGSATAETWRDLLRLAARTASSVPLFEMLLPAGLDRLHVAAKRYTENSAS